MVREAAPPSVRFLIEAIRGGAFNSYFAGKIESGAIHILCKLPVCDILL